MLGKASGVGRRKRKKVKRECLCPPAVCFPTLSSFIFAAPCLVRRTAAVFPMPGLCDCVSFVALCVIFLGVFLSWLWSSRQEGPRLQMWAGRAAENRAAHCTGCIGSAQVAIWSGILLSLNHTVYCQCFTPLKYTHQLCLNLSDAPPLPHTHTTSCCHCLFPSISYINVLKICGGESVPLKVGKLDKFGNCT